MVGEEEGGAELAAFAWQPDALPPSLPLPSSPPLLRQDHPLVRTLCSLSLSLSLSVVGFCGGRRGRVG
eukprot:996154-Rhodomonas_salina.1